MSLRRRARFLLATSGALERGVRASPALEREAWRRARRYVAGRTAEDALATAARLEDAGLAASIDLFGERVTDHAEARSVADAYVALAPRLQEGTWLSIDLSHIAFDEELLREIASALPPGARLQVGAEEQAVADRVLDQVLAAHADGLAVMPTLQANLPRSASDAERLAAVGAPVRLVKGAYVEDGALPWGPLVDAAYTRLAERLAAGGAQVALATHDRALRERVLRRVEPEACELLLGVQAADAAALARGGRKVRIYVPYGDNWFRYLMRRMAEAEGA